MAPAPPSWGWGGVAPAPPSWGWGRGGGGPSGRPPAVAPRRRWCRWCIGSQTDTRRRGLFDDVADTRQPEIPDLRPPRPTAAEPTRQPTHGSGAASTASKQLHPSSAHRLSSPRPGRGQHTKDAHAPVFRVFAWPVARALCRPRGRRAGPAAPKRHPAEPPVVRAAPAAAVRSSTDVVLVRTRLVGERRVRSPAARRRISIIFQNYTLGESRVRRPRVSASCG